jgi:hypothetical protein
MQMGDGFATIWAIVDNESVTGMSDAEAASDLGGCE